jgi:hypothetical protein
VYHTKHSFSNSFTFVFLSLLRPVPEAAGVFFVCGERTGARVSKPNNTCLCREREAVVLCESPYLAIGEDLPR